MADWIHFSITVTNHPKYSNHFLLIKTKLLPFIVEKDLTFWITNYGSQDDDSIAFRIVNVPEKIELTERFLDDLKAKEEIFNWQKSEWDPLADATARIENVQAHNQIGFDALSQRIVGIRNNIYLVEEETNLEEKRRQLKLLFESLGDCTKAIYQHLESQPKDLWVMSVFIHLLLNSLCFGGPEPPSQEVTIRGIPPW